MTAVKPALELITEGWQSEILSTLIHCDNVSGRSELSGRKVSTKLVLYLTENSEPMVKIKVVIHFYHTSSTIQVQGSSLLTCGTSAPVWVVKNFLEPLAVTHIQNHGDKIDAINTRIRETNLFTTNSCASCNDLICSTATQPKDQGLPCCKCGKMFHKRCTDRRKTTGNWRRNPWYCSECILGHQPQTDIVSTPLSSDLRPLAPVFHPQLHETDQGSITNRRLVITIPSQPSDQQQLCSGPGPSSISPHAQTSPANHGQDLGDMPVLSDSTTASKLPSESAEIPLLPPGSPPAHRPPVLPTTSVRQRTSNIRLDNPEAEFQKTALDSCRSTIVQQQSEIKRLSETLDIRNRRIMQLEDQIDVASSYMASRDTNVGSHNNRSNPVPPNNNIDSDSLALTISKLNTLVDQVTKSQTVNVYNYPCNSNKFKPNENDSKATQTDTVPPNVVPPDGTSLIENEGSHEETAHQCIICSETLRTHTELDEHIQSEHGASESLRIPFTCDYCGAKMRSEQFLHKHISDKHASLYLQCPKCKFRAQLNTQLEDHMIDCHTNKSSQNVNTKQLHQPGISSVTDRINPTFTSTVNSDKSSGSSSASSNSSPSL